MGLFPPVGQVKGASEWEERGRWKRLLNMLEGRRKEKAPPPPKKKGGKDQRERDSEGLGFHIDRGTGPGEQGRTWPREGFKINCIRRLIQSKSIQQKWLK